LANPKNASIVEFDKESPYFQILMEHIRDLFITNDLKFGKPDWYLVIEFIRSKNNQ
jgi:hypothetical protein